jgi:hypothetical protein
MATAFRRRLTHATLVGICAAVVAVATQYFIALPIGNQPDWLELLAMIAIAPSAYIIVPLRDPLEQWLQIQLGTGRVVEASTPFGPAFRIGTEDMLLVGFGTIVMVGIVAYLAEGVQEMMVNGKR